MPITSANTFSLSTIQRIVIDCASIPGSQTMNDDLEQLCAWIKSMPQRSAVHVTLRHATASVTGRKLKSIFQSLGCTVIMQTSFLKV